MIEENHENTSVRLLGTGIWSRDLPNASLVHYHGATSQGSVILLGFECTINSQNLIKIVRAIFEKFEILNFFVMWTTLNFRGRGKTKKTARDTYMRTLYIEFERDRSIGLGSTFGDGHTNRQTHTHTHTHTHARARADRQSFFLKHIFRLCEWCRMKNQKKNRSRKFWRLQ